MLNDIARENRVKDRMADLKMLSVSDAGSYVSGGMFENKEVFFDCFKVGRKSRKVAPLPRSEEGRGYGVAVREEKSGENLADEVREFIPDAHLELSPMREWETLVDLEKYIVLTVWIASEDEDPRKHSRDGKRHECDYRYYWNAEYISFMRHQQEEGKNDISKEKITYEEVVTGRDINIDKAAQHRFQAINEEYEVIHQKIGFKGWAAIEEIRRYPDNREELWLYGMGVWYERTPRPPHRDSVPKVIVGTWENGKYTRDREKHPW
jgi:hypothetical protein